MGGLLSVYYGFGRKGGPREKVLIVEEALNVRTLEIDLVGTTHNLKVVVHLPSTW